MDTKSTADIESVMCVVVDTRLCEKKETTLSRTDIKSNKKTNGVRFWPFLFSYTFAFRAQLFIFLAGTVWFWIGLLARPVTALENVSAAEAPSFDSKTPTTAR